MPEKKKQTSLTLSVSNHGELICYSLKHPSRIKIDSFAIHDAPICTSAGLSLHFRI